MAGSLAHSNPGLLFAAATTKVKSQTRCLEAWARFASLWWMRARSPFHAKSLPTRGAKQRPGPLHRC